MTQVLALAARHMEAIGAPVRRHVDLGQPYKQPAGIATAAADGGHSPSPLRSASSRKRASTIHAVDADRGMQESPSASSAGAQRQDGPRDIICLCTPAPKIPRPRNVLRAQRLTDLWAAFILYRQHHQAQVTADNPKLSNPDISKIIGEKWKNEDEEVKQTWKNLAEEEKQRHQTQYPNYRYQPRRGNKPQSAHAYVRTPLPELGNLPRSQSGPMPPPFRPSPSTSWLEKDPQNRRHSGFDESLRLPPLQSSVPPSPSRMPSMDTRRVSLPLGGVMESPPRESRGLSTGSLEESIMSIPFNRKLSVLASICRTAPPLARDAIPGGTRGAFIAVEGSDARLLREVGATIEKTLVACGDIDLKVWKDDFQERDPMVQASPLNRGGSKFGDSFEPYFDVVSAWQKKSKQIGRHVTGKTALNPTAEDQRADEDDKGPASAVKMPVALAKDGFSLTISDRYARTMPIQDTYSPLDHWQWMASLWRGTVCPDLVVHVMPADDDEANNRRVVELSRRMGSILVKMPSGKEMDEGTERRLAFEVMEWMREGSFRETLPQGWRSDPL
ncbi:SNF2 family helicase [Purpureocillium lavendulum]|uniref:SNF2 family helicase n=1 Tax=Purpureocillium lavendulum TaxID=1247861 RepID=A0AB34FS47_9HYPO|nr:SNF2 family helicase [Purpureocillium lavendulum]